MIATGAFPLSAALTPDGSDDFIAGEGECLPVSVLFNQNSQGYKPSKSHALPLSL